MLRHLLFFLLALPAFVIPASSVQFSVTLGNQITEDPEQASIRLLSKNIPTFNDERIKHYPDKKLLGRLRAFFKAFTTGDFEGMRDLQTPNYTMTNIHFGVVRTSRDAWYEGNKHLTGLIENLRVTAINLFGSSEPGDHSMLEHITSMELKIDPPPGLEWAFPVGAKAGDTVSIANLNVLWWDENGLITREFEYGGLTWPHFSLDQWKPKSSALWDL